MAEVLTPEKVLEYGMRVRELIFESGTPEERLAGLSPDQILEVLGPNEILAGLSPNEILAGLNSDERRALLRLLQEDMDAGGDGSPESNENS